MWYISLLVWITSERSTFFIDTHCHRLCRAGAYWEVSLGRKARRLTDVAWLPLCKMQPERVRCKPWDSWFHDEQDASPYSVGFANISNA